MRFVLGLSLCVMACGGSGASDNITGPPPTAKKVDPYLTVRMRNQLDTTTMAGRSHWHIFAILTSPQSPSQEGVSAWGAISLEDVRLRHDVICGKVASDSIGNRFLSLVAVADMTTEALTPDAEAASIGSRWYAGDRILPKGWKAIVVSPADAWDSQQFAEGHGRTPADPIKWGWDWTEAGGSSFYERVDQDATCNSF